MRPETKVRPYGDMYLVHEVMRIRERYLPVKTDRRWSALTDLSRLKMYTYVGYAALYRHGYDLCFDASISMKVSRSFSSLMIDRAIEHSLRGGYIERLEENDWNISLTKRSEHIAWDQLKIPWTENLMSDGSRGNPDRILTINNLAVREAIVKSTAWLILEATKTLHNTTVSCMAQIQNSPDPGGMVRFVTDASYA
jgi:hypothetical protein